MYCWHPAKFTPVCGIFFNPWTVSFITEIYLVHFVGVGIRGLRTGWPTLWCELRAPLFSIMIIDDMGSVSMPSHQDRKSILMANRLMIAWSPQPGIPTDKTMSVYWNETRWAWRMWTSSILATSGPYSFIHAMLPATGRTSARPYHTTQ